MNKFVGFSQLFFLICLSAAMGSGSAARADDAARPDPAGARPMTAAGHDRQNGPCRDDIKKFCADVKPGGGGIMKCMKEHEAELSPACKARGQEAKEAFKKIQSACQDDVEKFCKGVEPGRGGIFKCLHEHEKHLSAKCTEASHELRAKRAAMREHHEGGSEPAAPAKKE